MNTIQDWDATPRVENDVHRGKLNFNQDWRFFRGDQAGS